MRDPRSLVITGASSGIGAALAELYAAPRRTLLLVGRDADRLEAVAEKVRAEGGVAEIALVDTTDRPALVAALTEFDDRHPVDILIANAGVAAGLGSGRARESDADIDRQIAINLTGTLNTVNALVERMRQRRGGAICMTSSIAGLQPVADLPTYSATKAAIAAYGTALRRWLRRAKVSVTVICPGFVATPMAAKHHGAKPFEVTPDFAAREVRAAIQRRAALRVFPWQFRWLIRFGTLTPDVIVDRITDLFEAEVGAK
ncbi:SDR family NAD(P)-dependent oxidoreductase [Segnochrobactraceae bacterium EtOH-i3]